MLTFEPNNRRVEPIEDCLHEALERILRWPRTDFIHVVASLWPGSAHNLRNSDLSINFCCSEREISYIVFFLTEKDKATAVNMSERQKRDLWRAKLSSGVGWCSIVRSFHKNP